MSRELEVHIELCEETALVGKLYASMSRGRETFAFRYDRSWQARPGAFALEPGMPLASGVYTPESASGAALPSSVRDGAPDRWGITLIQRAARKENRTQMLGQVDYLLALDDFTRIGALRYREPGGVFQRVSNPRNVPPLIRLKALLNASDAVSRDDETAADLRFLLGYGSPLGGARPKSAIMDEDGRLAIAKFPKPDDTRSIAIGEVLALTLARRAGVDAAPARLLRVEDRTVSIIRRFDRDNGRRHFISALTMLGAREGDVETYEAIAERLRKFGSAPKKDVNELWRRLVFTILASNRDDHLRNHGFLHDGSGCWRLAPAYDVNPVPAYDRRPCLETWIDERGPEASVERAMERHAEFMLSLDEARAILAQVCDACEAWRSVGRQIGARDNELAPYETAFNHDELKIARSLIVARHGVAPRIDDNESPEDEPASDWPPRPSPFD